MIKLLLHLYILHVPLVKLRLKVRNFSLQLLDFLAIFHIKSCNACTSKCRAYRPILILNLCLFLDQLLFLLHELLNLLFLGVQACRRLLQLLLQLEDLFLKRFSLFKLLFVLLLAGLRIASDRFFELVMFIAKLGESALFFLQVIMSDLLA